MAQNKSTDDALIYYALFNDKYCFRNFWRPVAQRETCYRTYNWQLPEALSDNLVNVAGRGIGKSIGTECWFVQQLMTRQMTEGMMTSFRSMHMHDRFEAIISFFYKIKYFKHFLHGKYPIKRQPVYQINLKNGVVGYGIAIGDDPQAVNMTGKHPTFRAIEEAQFYPKYAFIQFQGAVSPDGSVDRAIGVPDAMIDSVFRRLDSSSDSMGKYRLHQSRRFNPALTAEQLKDLFSRYGGETTSEALNQVDGLWGEPVASAWDLEAIKNCMTLDRKDPDYSAYFAEIKRKPFEEFHENLEAFLPNLPYKEGVDNYILGIDVGGGLRPTVVLIFTDIAGKHGHRRYQQIARINLEKFTTPQSAKVLDYLYAFYKIQARTLLSIDCTSGDGRSIADTLEDPKGKYTWTDYKKIIRRVSFQSTVKTGEETTPEGKKKEIKESIKDLSCRVLRNMFQIKGRIKLPYDSDILEEFGSEVKVWEARAAKYYIKTPDDIHIPEAMRCFAYLVWLLYEAGEQMTTDEEAFVMPQSSEIPNILRTRNG
jgi:hypothetical protein